MRRLGDLMKELGFNPEAPLETQKAFFKHLARAAENSVLKKPEITPNNKAVSEKQAAPQQLSFDSEILGMSSANHLPKRKAVGKK